MEWICIRRVELKLGNVYDIAGEVQVARILQTVLVVVVHLVEVTLIHV